MLRKNRLVKFLPIAAFAVSTHVGASEGVAVGHTLYSHSMANGLSSLTFQLTVSNNGFESLKNVTIEPSSSEFIGNSNKLSIKLPALPANGTLTSIWEVSSSIEASYFQYPSVLNFTVTGTTDSGATVQYAVVSEAKK